MRSNGSSVPGRLTTRVVASGDSSIEAKRQVVLDACVKLMPATSTAVPPTVGPAEGESEVSIGSG